MKASKKKLTIQPVNPFCTGGGGQGFELLVAVSYLISLLRQEFARGVPDGVTTEVRLQQRNRGCPVDDIVAVCQCGAKTHRLYLQAKHRIIFSDNQLFNEVIGDAWWEFSKPNFKRNVDRVGLAIGEACNNSTVKDHVKDVLAWAEKSVDSKGFYQKVGSFVAKRKVLRIFENALAKAAGRKLAPLAVLRFLKHFIVVSFDFDTVAGYHSFGCWNQLLECLDRRDPRNAKALFEILRGMATEYAQHGGEIDRQALAARISGSASFAVPALEREGACILDILNRRLESAA